MARLTIKQKAQLNSMNASSTRAGGLGTIIDTMQYAGAVTPATGTLTPGTLMHYQFAPANGAADAVHAAITLTTATQTITTGITNPDFARFVVIVSNNAITTKVTITGKDIAGAAISEELTLNGTTPVPSTKAFATVTSIALPVRTNVGDTVTVGTINTFGMPHKIAYATCLLVKLFNGSTDSGTLAVDGTDLCKNRFPVNGTPDGAKKVDLYYIA